jgi:hypothetical protein
VTFIAVMSFVNWRATFVAFVVPYIFIRVAMMIGNWGQHAFVDPSRPGDSYVNSVTWINTPYNKRCFNDGYHIGHHVKQSRHWTEMPQDFIENQERYFKEGAVVFEGLDNFTTAILLFVKGYPTLAKHFVRLPGDERTDEQVIEFLKSRTKRIPDEVAAFTRAWSCTTVTRSARRSPGCSTACCRSSMSARSMVAPAIRASPARSPATVQCRASVTS